MKKALIIIICIIMLITICYLIWGRDVYYNLRDRTYWTELSSKISKSQIEEVLLDNSVFLEGDEFENFITDLNTAKYYKSNWRKEGPTGPLITIEFNDGMSEHFQYWGNGIYETSYKKGQFLIQNIKLDNILQKYNINDMY